MRPISCHAIAGPTRRTLSRLGSCAALVALSAQPALADRRPEVHALTDARIVQGPDRTIESGTLVLRDGVIEAVGADVTVPADARVWEMEGLTLYPGLIESFHTREWPTRGDDDSESGDASAEAQGLHPNPLVRPERDMTLHAFDEGAAKKLRGAGFTTAVVVPEDGLWRGSSVLIQAGDGSVHENLLRREVAQNLRLTTGAGQYPSSLMGAVALLRQSLYDARWHADAREAYDANPRQKRPMYSISLAALEAVARGEAPVVMESSDVHDALRLARLAEEFGLDATIVGTGEEYQRLDAIAATGLPFLVPVKFPKEPTVGEEDDLSVGLGTLRHWDRAPDNPKLLLDAGVPVALTSHGLSEPKKIHAMLARSIERGLGPDQALAALTTVPAKWLGIADRAGTLDVGKLANVVVVEGEMFVDKPKVRAVFVDGHRFEVEESKPPTVDPIGTWAIVIDAGPGGQIPVTVTFEGSVEDLSGKISAMGGVLPMTEAEVSDDTVAFAFDSTPLGMPGSISFAMKIDGESCSGTGSSPQGDFEFSGDRTDRPDDAPEALGDLALLLDGGIQ